ncbi:MAG TPA: hypothetical protein VD866_12685 [Urbifossiella sp.]|nr:hypothetical protein [Urbifossiella sp.]
MAKHVGSDVLVTRLLLATLVGVPSGWYLVVCFAFASMTGVTPSGSPEWWAAALDRLFFSGSDAWFAWVLAALVLTCAGIAARDLVVLLYRIGAGLTTASAHSPHTPGPDPPTNGAVG